MRAADIEGDPGESVRELAKRLMIRRTRFRPLLPLGRARNWEVHLSSEALDAHADPLELIQGGFHPTATCGLGQNLYVEPSGRSFPCYAYHRPHSFLGNVIETGLRTMVKSLSFIELARHSVDTDPHCRTCELRYLCGGACRAWGGEIAQYDLDAPPNCEGLRERFSCLLVAAQGYLSNETKN